VEQITATMLHYRDSIYKNTIVENRAFFYSIYGRNLTPGEIGCALSHNYARKLAGYSGRGALILEDDARLLDVDQIYSTVMRFLDSYQHQAAVLSLFDGKDRSLPRFKTLKNQSFYLRSLGPTAYALAYAVTPRAGRELNSSNSRLQYVADWPRAKVHFFSLSTALVKHGDEFTSSTIVENTSNDFRLEKSASHTLRALFRYRFSNKISNKSFFSLFVVLAWIHRFYSIINRIVHLSLFR
jgi:GR25 family glycosyltransferase involved in LPS biosynthesis